MMKHKYTFAAIAVFAFMFASPAWALPRPAAATYGWGVQFTVAGYSGSESFANVPVLVRLAENSPSGFSYSQLQSQTDGADLCFIDMLGNGLPFEIDTWNTSGESLVWVLLPTLESTTQFVMCWGGATSGKTVCPDNPWSGYKGVWHMNAVSPADASGCGNDGTASGDVALATGAVGSGLSYPNQNAFVSCGKNLSNADLAAGYTMEGWVNLANTSGNKAVFGKDSFISLRMEGSSIKITTPGVSDYGNVNNFITAAGEWHHVALTFVPNATGGAKIYLDGEGKSAQNTGRIGNTTSSTELWLAHNQWGNGQGFTGILDEYRVYPGVRSAEWLAVSYAAQAVDSFLTAGDATAYEVTSAPQVGLAVSSVQYTNATFTASVGSLGMDSGMTTDASWADLLLVVGTDDTLASPLFSIPFDRVTATPVSVSTFLSGLVTNTTYWAQLRSTNSFDVVGESTAFSFTTLNPGSATGIANFSGRGFSTLSVTGYATDFGAGSDSATIRLEASADDFATVAASSEVDAALDAPALFTVSGLLPATDYQLRLRIVNEWGLAGYVALPGTYATRTVPVAAVGIGYEFAADGSTVDFSFGVSHVFDGATCTATLEYGGKTAATKTFSGTETLTWPGIAPAAGSAATVTVSAIVDGQTYTETWTVAVASGSAAKVVSSLAELRAAVVHVGDRIVLPELTGADDYYLMLDVRPFKLDADGRTLIAVEPGFAAIAAFEYDAASAAFVRNAAMGLAVCLPKAEGRVFLAQAGGADMNWSETAKWRCLSDPTVTGEYPDGAGDVAMVPLAKDKAITLDVDATVGAVYVGWDATVPASGTIRFAGANKTLTFDSGEKGVSGLFRIAGLNRSDVNSERPNFTLGSSGSGSRLVLAMPKGLVLDGGKHPDVANTTLRNVNNRINFRNGYGNVEVPAGQTFSIVNMDHAGWSDGQMYNCSTFIWNANFPLSGSGTVVYDTAALGFFDGALKNFAGTLVIRQKQRYTAYGVDSRGGGFWLKANVGYAAENATFVVEGESVYASNGSYSSTLGLATWGSSHGSGSWGPGDNSIGGKALVMAGGTLIQRGNNTKNWENNGIVENPNRSDALVVSNGYSVVEQTYQMTALPTNRLEFASLRHANRGTIRIATTDISNYEQKSLSTVSHCIVHGADAFAIGGGGADGSFTESVVPWIIGLQQWNNRAYFPHVGTRDGETNCLVMTTHPTSKSSLAAATDPDENVLVHEKTIALSADVTVNALYLNKNWSKGTALGAGRTLAVTSGGVILEGERCAIGTESDFTAGTAGTLFLPNEGYLYSTVQSATEPNEIWASIVASRGLAISFPGFLRLGGDQTGIDEELAINGCDVTLGSATTGCEIDVPVRLESGAAVLRIGKEGSFCNQTLYLNDHGTDGAKFIPAAGTTEKVYKLYIDGVNMPCGTYGATGSGAQYIDDRHFSGTGIARVMKDDLTHPLILIVR